MARYIDADKLNKKKKYLFRTQGEPFPKSEWFIKADDFFSAPTAGVVKVIRCKDCKDFEPHGNGKAGICRNKKLKPCLRYVTDFCSYGEKALKERERE